MNKFLELGLHPQLVQAVEELGYTEPTPIQTEVVPFLLAGQDVLAQSQTGSGKTAAFALPALTRIEVGTGSPQMLVVAPTRELAMQVAKAIQDYGKHLKIRTLAIYGGQPYGLQKRELRRGVDVVVGTPGRMLDLINQRALDLSKVKIVVLDEADEMLSMGFVDDIETILKATSETRQTALFSATLPSQIRRLAQKYLNDPQTVMIERKEMTADNIDQRYYLVNQGDKLAAITRLFEIEEITSALIFARTRARTGDLAVALTQRNYPAEVINGDLSQDARTRVLNRFRNGNIKILVATDVAARGLDIDDISHVFNYDMPDDPEIFVHRIGRTGRAGRSGVALSLITPKEKHRLRQLEKYTRKTITKATLPTKDDIFKHREQQLLDQLVMWLNRDRARREKEMIEGLIEEGHDLMDIAASALKMARAQDKQRPVAEISEAKESRDRGKRDRNSRSRGGRNDRNGRSNNRRNTGNGQSNRNYGKTSHEDGMVRLSLDRGKQDGVRPQDIVGTIAHHSGISGREIGKILIEHERTMVDIPEAHVSKVLSMSGSYEVNRKRIQVVKAG